MKTDLLESAAERLAEVQAGRASALASLAPLPATMDEAYRIQAATVARLGRVGGWKHALLAGQTLACAPILASAIRPNGAALPLTPNLRVEVETAIRLSAPLRAGAPLAEIRAAIGGVALAFECLGSRFADPGARAPLELMADRFSTHAVVLGADIPNWETRDLADLPIVAAGFAIGGAPTPGMSLPETLDFLGFLAARAEEQGTPLEAGQVIITGARLGPFAVTHPAKVQATAGDASVDLLLE